MSAYDDAAFFAGVIVRAFCSLIVLRLPLPPPLLGFDAGEEARLEARDEAADEDEDKEEEEEEEEEGREDDARAFGADAADAAVFIVTRVGVERRLDCALPPLEAALPAPNAAAEALAEAAVLRVAAPVIPRPALNKAEAAEGAEGTNADDVPPAAKKAACLRAAIVSWRSTTALACSCASCCLTWPSCSARDVGD